MITLEQPIAAAEGRPSRETDQSQASRRITEGGGESRPQIQQMEPPNWYTSILGLPYDDVAIPAPSCKVAYF